MKVKTLIFKATRQTMWRVKTGVQNILFKLKLWFLDVQYGSVCIHGIPYINVSYKGKMIIGKGLKLNSGIASNPIGCYERCTIVVQPGATLKIGDNVGISQSALIAADDITIGNNVKIGGGTYVWTTDFHSLDSSIRASREDISMRVCAPVRIEDNAFIGGRSLILKGVTIGKNSIVAAGSVVTRNIPDNQIWGGNPAKFIRNI